MSGDGMRRRVPFRRANQRQGGRQAHPPRHQIRSSPLARTVREAEAGTPGTHPYTWYRSRPSRSSRRYGGRRAGRVIRSMVLATVARDQRDLHETMAPKTISTVKTSSPHQPPVSRWPRPPRPGRWEAPAGVLPGRGAVRGSAAVGFWRHHHHFRGLEPLSSWSYSKGPKN